MGEHYTFTFPGGEDVTLPVFGLVDGNDWKRIVLHAQRVPVIAQLLREANGDEVPLRVIAERLGIHTETLHHWLKRHCIHPRPWRYGHNQRHLVFVDGVPPFNKQEYVDRLQAYREQHGGSAWPQH